MLIVFAGLPGTGKTTIAAALAERLRCACIRIDAIGADLRRAGATPDPVGLADYVIAEAITEDNLRAGATVIVDAVNDSDEPRKTWRALARRRGVALRFIEVLCSDELEHRRRVESREWHISELQRPTWDDVRARRYEPMIDAHLALDAAAPIEDCVSKALEYVR